MRVKLEPTEKLRQIAAKLTELTGVEWKLAYIGNCDHRHDDRSWFLYVPHPDRVGTYADRLGGFTTDKLDEFVQFASNVLTTVAFLRRHGMLNTNDNN